jgi:hypothetical protein
MFPRYLSRRRRAGDDPTVAFPRQAQMSGYAAFVARSVGAVTLPRWFGRQSAPSGQAHGPPRLLNEKGNAMNVKTEARNETSNPETMVATHEANASQVTGIDSNVQDRQPSGGHRRIWVIALALVASAGLASAAMVSAFDSSSDADNVTPTEFADPALDKDFHREPGQTVLEGGLPAEGDRDFHREPGQSSSDDEVKPYGSGLPHEAH